MTDPQSQATSYVYDVLNRLKTLTSPQGSFGFTYDALSRRTQMTRPNGITTNYTYNPVSTLASVLHQAGNTIRDGATYTYDAAGNRLTKVDKRTGTQSNYTYDAIYQLTKTTQGTHSPTTTETYSYDPVGNRLSSLGVSPYSYNSSNELTSIPSLTYTYDSNGNTKTKSDGTHYTWDFENRLTQVVLPGTGGTVTFKYDPLGRRIQKAFTKNSTTTTTNYLYDGMNVVEGVDNSGNVLARYMHGAVIDEDLSVLSNGTTSYYQADGLGSITSLSNSAGALANTYTYDGFGKLTASTGTLTNPFQYTGRELDSETGIYFYRARYYDTTNGRFLTEDPIGFNGGPNFYSYVANSPINLIDPSGLLGIEPPTAAQLAGLQNLFPRSKPDGSSLVVPESCDDVMRTLDNLPFKFATPNNWHTGPSWLFHSSAHEGGTEVHGVIDGLHFRVKPGSNCNECVLDEFHNDPHNPLFEPNKHIIFDAVPWWISTHAPPFGSTPILRW
jgi:RHS repeat-associated protein